MAAAAAGDPNPSLALGHPQYRCALGAFKKAIEILLLPTLNKPGTAVAEGLDPLQKPLVFLLPPGNIPTEYPKIAVPQTDERHEPEDTADSSGQKHGKKQQTAGQKACGHGKGI